MGEEFGRRRELDRRKLLAAEKAVKEIVKERRFNKLKFYVPYPKQRLFHDLGIQFRERLFMAGNQVGKTWCGGAEAAYHMTGLYPDDWLGRRWDRPTRGWVAGVTGESTRDNPQRVLLGTAADIAQYGIGTGMIPNDTTDASKWTLARGVSNLYDTGLVKHKSGSYSEVKFKSYEKGREKWQGDTLDWIWFDEEPPDDVYSEGLARLREGGMVFITFTPLQGWSTVVDLFFKNKTKDREVVNMGLADAQHFSAEEKQKRLTSYPTHERAAREKGEPLLGQGKIFPYTEESLTVTPFPVMPHWKLIWGLDFGIDHPFAAVLLAWDVDHDIIYVIRCIRMSDALPLQHVQAMKPTLQGLGMRAPVAWPQDGWQRKDFGGKLKPVAEIYRALDLNMCADHAKFSDGSNSTEAGIMGMSEYMQAGRFKVFADCTEWFEEYRFYHRDDGQIVRRKDDLMSATRTAFISRRFATSVLWAPGSTNGRTEVAIARDVDIDPFM